MSPAPFSSSKYRRTVKALPSWCAVLDELIDQILARNVTGAVSRLAHIELLLEAQQIEVGPHPAARSSFHLISLGLGDVELIGLRVQRGEPARAALRQHDPDDLARSRIVVVIARAQ